MDPTTLKDKILASGSLPTLPAAALRVVQLTADDQLPLDELGRAVASDPALSSKVLRAVNSSLYGLPHKVASVQQAVALLGAKAVRTLVLSFSLKGALTRQSKGNAGFDPLAYWRRSMYAATAARITADRVLPGKVEECVVAALLMDVGCLVLDITLGRQYGAVCLRARSHVELAEFEHEMLGMSHADVGAMLAAHWELPDVLRVPVASHHTPEAIEDPSLRKVTQVVSLAGRVADVFSGGSASAAEPISAVRSAFKALYGISEIDCDGLLCQIAMKTGEFAPLFDVKLNDESNYEDILAKASKRLLELADAGAGQDAAPANLRRAARLRKDGTITIVPCSPNPAFNKPIVTRLRDLSSMGIGFSHTLPIPVGTQFVVQIPQTATDTKTLLYKVVRCETGVGGASLIGASLVTVLKPGDVAPPAFDAGSAAA